MLELPSRRDAVLVAAVEVLGSGGSRALTHRAVDKRAQLAEGTTSNYFRTRIALLAGVLGHISAAEAAPITALPSDRDGLVSLAAERIEFLLGAGRALTLARHALFVEAAFDPGLREDLYTESKRWWDLGAAILARLDVPDPQQRSRWLFAYLDGLLADQLARPQQDFDPAAAIGTALDGFLAC